MDYQKQAQDFLEKTGATITFKKLGHYPYFDGDKESRDVYEFTITRKNRKFTGKFGQSIVDSRKGKRPTAYDVLACLQKYDPRTFRDFCADFGYSDDSLKAQKLYFAVQDEWAGVSRIFGDVLDELLEIS